jgi:molecular chaperone DnaJ
LNAFELLGVRADADVEQVKHAYHCRAKENHPDRFLDPAEQQAAHQRMVELNLAYEQVIKQVQSRRPVFHEVPLERVKATVRRLIDQKHYDSALLHLGRADSKDAQWYALQGEVLMAFREYGTAHQSFRQAVQLEPDDMRYRQMALDAAIQVKRHKQLPLRLKDSIDALFQGRRRR